jgi:hypothetical protein
MSMSYDFWKGLETLRLTWGCFDLIKLLIGVMRFWLSN